MTITSYNRLKAALIQQRREVTASPQAASRFIDDLGLRDVVIISNPPAKEASSSKADTRKAIPKKVSRK
jgi:hypothetical protein